MAARTLLLVAALATAGIATPLESRQNCGAVWTQCGGQGWSGSSCCASGSTCSVINEWYHQCIPGAAVPSSSSSSSSSRSSTSPTSTRVSTASTTSRATSTTGGVTRTSSTSAGVTQPPASGTATWAGNPFSGVNQWANSYYASEILNLAVPSLSGAQATAAAKVAEVPTFMWLDTFSKTPLMRSTLADIRKANAAGGNYAGQFVVYDLPDRDCAAAASNGEYAIDNGGVEKYKTYIDTIREIIITYSDIRILLAIEPDSLANMVTNMGVAKCARAAPYYHDLTQYAIKQLNLPNVAMYLDAGHAGWLGYPDNSVKAAQMFAEVYKEAGRPKALRGLVTNVSNYNAWSLTSPPPYVDGAATYDEKKYVNLIAPLLEAQGWTGVKFIVDQGRSGKQPTGQTAWGHWCNAIGTGFGPRPSTNTGDALVDAFVWVKPGGECDGTSDTTAARYDLNCGREDALKPAPEAGTWFQAYFVQLLNNASPAF